MATRHFIYVGTDRPDLRHPDGGSGANNNWLNISTASRRGRPLDHLTHPRHPQSMP
jgi:hypothetical protein